jgi:hypothetical protein
MKEKIETILVKYDPVKLIKIGAPLDEYDSEAQMICERTTRHFSLDKIHNIVYDVFYSQFGGGTVYKANRQGEMIAIGDDIAPVEVTVRIIGKFEEYLSIAQEIKELLDQEKTRTT